MVRLREIPRTATFAWSPGATSPWLATGTKSGAVDVDFSNETCLEFWDLALDDTSQGQELQPAITIPTETGFHDLAWVSPSETYNRGIVAGALDNGCLSLWDVDKTLSSGSGASISNDKIHSGAIKALQFNPKISSLLATGGTKGEVFITDLNNAKNPVRLGSTAARADDIDCLDWNKKVSHIMVTGSSGGFVTVWDMKTKKESLTLNNSGRKAVSAVAWDPEKPTRLITAVPLEQEPVILVWDLRNSNAPEKVLRGHDSGVLSLSWCVQDSDLLLSCGKDNRTMLWNPQTGQAYGDYPVVTNWTFQTRWNPHNPNMFATASFDGKLQVQTLQNTNPASTHARDQTQAADGEDFFSRAQTQPQTSSFSLGKAPKWLERPVSVSFGFGGRLISVVPEPGQSRGSRISISKFEVESSVGSATDTFERAIQSGDLSDLCQTRVSEAQSEDEKADWQVIQTLVSKNPREELIKYLGFTDADEAADGIAQLGLNGDKTDSLKPEVNGAAKGHKRFSSMFDSTPEGDFLSELAATKGTKTNNPFQIFSGSESEADRRITRALMLGQFEKALDVCLQEDRMSDAFMVAICGGDTCLKKAQEAYFAKQSGGPNYLRLLASVVGKNLWDIVHNADLANWKEVMATLCTFADEREFPDLCEALGDRLEEQFQSTSGARKDASFCFLAGSKLEKVVEIWIDELQEHESSSTTQEGDTSAFSIHARGLQDFIEKVTIFRNVVNYKDAELSKPSSWKLDELYGKYLEYADIVAAHGQLAVAQKYLDLIPAKYPEADVARSRIQQATNKPSIAAGTAQTKPSTLQKPLPSVGGYQPGSTFSQPTPQPLQPLVPQGLPVAPSVSSSYASPLQQANPYAPTTQPINPYAPAGGYQPQQQMRSSAPPPPQHFGMPQAQPIAPPPRAYNQSPSVPAPSRDRNMTNWNDLPEGFGRAPTPRRGTPSVPSQGVLSPFPGQPPLGAPGLAPPPMGAQRSMPPTAPPPKGSAPPPKRVTSPPTGETPNPYAPVDRPPSGNVYAPPPNFTSPAMGQNIAPPPIPRGPSPFTAPPSNAPPTNRYAPAPGSQTSGPKSSSRPSIAPPPPASSFQAPPLPASPYGAPQPQIQPPMYPHAPPPVSFAPPPAAEPARPASRPDTANSGQRSVPSAVKKHPKGDRTHIPHNAMPIYEILSSEMGRVKARAPSSFKAQVHDTEKRLDILFDHLNNEDLLKPDTVGQMMDLSQALEAKDFGRASEIQMEVHRDKVDECGNWMVGVKRLVGMCKAIG